MPLSFGTDESPIDIMLGSATVRAVGNADAPSSGHRCKPPAVATNHVQLTDLGITLHSDAFNLTGAVGSRVPVRRRPQT